MVKPLTFKGDKKPKKRKRTETGESAGQDQDVERQSKAAKEADADDAENDDSWVSADVVSDVSGPVMLVLPTEPPSALACDANGKVFTLPIENIVDGNPSSAEPHDVRQVWVANRIAGTEHFRFKGHHGKYVNSHPSSFSVRPPTFVTVGQDEARTSNTKPRHTRYLSCSKIGLLTATADAITPLESFNLIATADTPGTFQVQTLRDTFLSVHYPPSSSSSSSSSKRAPAPEVRGDATEIAFDTTLRVRMQARFKPRLRQSKEDKARERITRRELEQAAGRRLDEDEVKRLKRARREGNYHEALLDIKVKSKHDKFG